MPIYSVSQITGYLRDMLLQDALLQDLWVQGEVGNLSKPGSGHSYFSLRDARSSLRCVVFRGEVSAGAELLSNGAAVIAHGRFGIYEVRGELQLIADLVQPEGVGELQLRLEQLKLKLQKEGLFEESRKRPLPVYPRRLGVITSPSGAVWSDIQMVVRRRYPLVELLLAPTPVQGDQAVGGIAEAFGAFNRMPDVDAVILARGGGSLEDLWPFNEEAVARAIFASRAPVISGVGHETDFTIADMVADSRAPTPSAAAELAVPHRVEVAARIRATEQALTTWLSDLVGTTWVRLGHLQERVRRRQPDLDTLRLKIDDVLKTAARNLQRDIALKSERADGLTMRLESLSPKDTLRRGYAIVQTHSNGEVVSSHEQVGTGDSVKVTLARGGFGAEVVSTHGDDSPTGDGHPREAELPPRNRARF